VFAAACALVAARERASARLVDLDGDQVPILGLPSDPTTGVSDWLRAGVDAPVDALDRIGVPVGAGLTLLPAGQVDASQAPPEVGAALGVALRETGSTTIVDAGVPDTPARDALLAVADASILVVRPCYLTLRRAVRSSATAHAAGVVVVEEAGRALTARDVADILGRPVLASIAARSPIARVVDAGVLTTRMPDALAKPARAVLARVGGTGRSGRAA
jgi:hypothetical protein